MENANVNGMLTRKERVMKQESEIRKTLEHNVSTLQSSNNTLQSAITTLQSHISALETQLSEETSKRQRSDIEYSALTNQVNLSSERSRKDLQALRNSLLNLKQGRKDDARTLQLMATELDRLTITYSRERDAANDLAGEIGRVKEKHREQIERAMRVLRRELETQLVGNEENLDRTGEVLRELRAINGKIRAVDHG